MNILNNTVKLGVCMNNLMNNDKLNVKEGRDMPSIDWNEMNGQLRYLKGHAYFDDDSLYGEDIYESLEMSGYFDDCDMQFN